MIQVPRDLTKNNKGITTDLEAFLDTFLNREEEDGQPYHLDELKIIADVQLRDKYPDTNLTGKDSCYVGYALNTLCFNRCIKKVGPNIYENVDGPDPELERVTGYAPEGKWVNRSYNVYEKEKPGYLKQWKSDCDKVKISVKILREIGKSDKEISEELNNERFNQTALRLELKKMSLDITRDLIEINT